MADNRLGDCVVCPHCGLPGIPVWYGYPTPEAMAEVAAGRLALGGCVIGPDGSRRAQYACPRGHVWSGAGRVPDGQVSATASASRMHAAGDLAGAERGYRQALQASTERHGEGDSETRALRHALAIVLFAAGRPDEAAAVYAPLR
jgi:hypothetical protein